MVELPEVRFPVDSRVTKMTYKAMLTTKRGVYSGIMVIKRMEDNSFRIAFFSEVGMGYLEASMEGTYPYELEVRSISPFISSSKVVQNIEESLNLLLASKENMVSGDVYKDEENRYWISAETTGENRYWGRIEDTGKVDRAFLKKGNKMEAEFSYSNDPHPSIAKIMDKNDHLVLVLIKK
jgi:hypothetical protein